MATLSAIVEMTCSSIIVAITMFLSSLSPLLAVETFRLGFPMFTHGMVDGERRRYYVSMASLKQCACKWAILHVFDTAGFNTPITHVFCVYCSNSNDGRNADFRVACYVSCSISYSI